VDFADGNGITMLSRAVLNNEVEMARMLIERGANLNSVDKMGMTPLLWAATMDFGDTAMSELLLKAGARRDATSKEGLTALELARQYGHSYQISVLK
jgi:ankyrin repeat protein